MANVQIKRAYEPYSREDGYRVLVDRLWPRGVSKAKAHINVWLKDVAPSNALRKWYAHDPKRWPEFKRRYGTELRSGLGRAAIKRLRELIRIHRKITLVYAAKDARHSNAAALLPRLRRSR